MDKDKKYPPLRVITMDDIKKNSDAQKESKNGPRNADEKDDAYQEAIVKTLVINVSKLSESFNTMSMLAQMMHNLMATVMFMVPNYLNITHEQFEEAYRRAVGGECPPELIKTMYGVEKK